MSLSKNSEIFFSSALVSQLCILGSCCNQFWSIFLNCLTETVLNILNKLIDFLNEFLDEICKKIIDIVRIMAAILIK